MIYLAVMLNEVKHLVSHQIIRPFTSFRMVKYIKLINARKNLICKLAFDH
jgi:hypothetical protein